MLFIALLGLALLAPTVPFVVIRRHGQASPPSAPRRQLTRRAAIAGGLGIIPAGFLFTLAAYGDWLALLLICALGAAYGAIVGAVIQRLCVAGHRNRTT